MKHSDSLAKIAPALVAAQSELKAIHKDATNPHFNSRFASLDNIIDAVRPVLTKHGLAVVQGATTPHSSEEGKLVAFAVETMLIHSSGEFVTNTAIMPLGKADPQGAGGAMTYGRRYALSALLSLSTDEDDDGNAASAPPTARVQVSEGNGRPPIQSHPSPSPTSSPRSTSSPSGEPTCPKCGGAMWNNVKDNEKRYHAGQKLRPHYSCKDKDGGCKGVIWPPDGWTPDGAEAA